MRWLLFLSRVAFICNVFFLLAVSLQLFHWLPGKEVQSTVIILGLVMAAILNPAVNICYGVLFLSEKEKMQPIPRWLLFSNVGFLILQIIYFFFRNGY